ncbi:MAG: hypothetical protein QN174_11325 [Armatimonadota bacterium]|nr:hypothetical protein [Armatimonadota bacterium]MDR7497535.1 hypothetical protein [Armatimonadota bacterium]MDR7511121.1 hypothetical protein [Armatimonadota bacterium]
MTPAGEPRGSAAPAAPRLPDLRIVATTSLLLHEDTDPLRVERLARSLEVDGILRNPPVVAPLPDGRHVVLDGANRVSALRQGGYPHQLVQVVDYDAPEVRLEVWAHLLQDATGLRAALAGGGGPWAAATPEALQVGLAEGRFACAVLTAQEGRGLEAPDGLAGRVAALAEVVAGYRGRTAIYRVAPGSLETFAREYGHADALVLFPPFTKDDIRAIAQLPVRLPSGISRHLVPYRALRVDLDLAILRTDEPTAAKQAKLDEHVRARLLAHRVRHYPESTVLYDE